jgi:CheY-like chemotaxis protein/anti-sigma regulatory factor (Ser/Thr protein kinase)
VPTRVLLVDDVAEVRERVRGALGARVGFDVVGEAADGSEAVTLVAGLQPDIVVLDLGLPDLAGRDVLSRIRELSPTSKVVVFSGTEPADRAWIADQVEGFVLKDGDLDYLIELLEALGRPPERQASLPLPMEAASVARARNFVRGALSAWGLSSLTPDVILVVSELVTNAITHGQSDCELRLSMTEAAMRIEVADHGAGTPDPRRTDDSAEHGRGLHLVSALSTAWGVQVAPDGGKLVWAELARA